MGAVYRARDQRLRRQVAVKVLAQGSARRRDRFQVEARAVARLQHPNIVQLFDVGEHDSTAYLVLELVEGGSLSQRLSGKPQPPRESAALVQALATAVQHAHAHGIVHRDLKPSNILLAGLVPKIADFGLARLLEEEGQTQDGEVLGTPSYMAPEQAGATPQQIGPACDIYALGAILYEMLTGRPPFRGQSIMDTLHQVMHHEAAAPRLLNPAVPRNLETICLKCLHKDPARRYASAEELADDLGRFLDGRTILARPASSLEKALRWARRNRGIAAALSAVAVLLLVLVVGAVVAAERFRLQAEANARLAAEKEQQREAAVEAGEVARRQREAAVAASNLAERRGEELLENVYRDWMHLAVQATTSPTGMPRVNELTEAWRDRKPDVRGWEWYHLRGLGERAEAALPGHDKWSCVAWSPDGAWLAWAGPGGGVCVRDAVDGRLVRTLGSGAVSALAFSPDGRRLAVGQNSALTVWRVADGEPIASFLGHAWYVHGLAWSPNGKKLASAGADHTIVVRDVPDRKGSWTWGWKTFRGHTEAVKAVSWSPDGKRLASGSWDRTVRVWDAATGKQERLISGDAMQGVEALAFSPDGAALAAAGHDGHLRIWDASSFSRRHQSRLHTQAIYALAWSHDSRRLATGGSDHLIKITQATTGQEVLAFRGHTDAVRSLCWAPGSDHLASAALDGSARVWETVPAPETIAGPGNIHSLAWSADGQQLAVGAAGGIGVWDTRTGERVRRYSELCGMGHLPRVQWLPDGRLAWLPSWNPDVKHASVRIDDPSGKARPVVFPRADQGLLSLAVSPDGSRLAWGGWEAALYLQSSTATGPVLRLPQTGGVHQLAWAPRGRRLAVLSDWAVGVVDGFSGEKVWRVQGRANCRALAWSPDGRRLATGDDGNLVRIWDAEGGAEVMTLHGHTDALTSLAYSPDGSRLASAGKGGTVRLWDVASGHEVIALGGYGGAALAVAWSLDGLRLAVGDEHGTIHIHDATPGHVAERSAALLARKGDTETHRLSGEVLARKGELDAAADEFRKADVSGDGLFSGGWRLAGPLAAEPGPADPFAADGVEWRWEWETDGWVRVRRGKGVVVAAHRVWSPRACQVRARLTVPCAARLWANGRLTYEADRPTPPGVGAEATVSLAAGWNTLVLRLAACEEGAAFRCALEGPAEREWAGVRDLLLRHAWKDAEAALGKARSAYPDSAAWLTRCAVRVAWAQVEHMRRRGDTGVREARRLLALCAADAGTATLLGNLLADEVLARPYVPLKPASAKSEGGATLTIQRDHSILASGKHPARDAYIVEMEVEPGGITGLQMEVLTDPSLPGGGPGRVKDKGFDGQFHLHHVSVTRTDRDGKEVPVALTRTKTSFTSPYSTAQGGLDATIARRPFAWWEIYPRMGTSQTAWLDLAGPVGTRPGTRLKVRLDFYGYAGHPQSLGKFRLSASTAPTPLLARLWLERGGEGWGRLGAARYFRGEYEQARAALRKAVEQPARAAATDFLLLSLACDRLGLQSEAKDAHARWVELGSHRVEGEAMLQLAIEGELSQIAREPHDAAARLRRAGWYATRYRTDLVAADMAVVIDRLPRWKEQAEISVLLAGVEEAERTLGGAVWTADYRTMAHSLRAMIWDKQGRAKEARAALDQAVKEAKGLAEHLRDPRSLPNLLLAEAKATLGAAK